MGCHREVAARRKDERGRGKGRCFPLSQSERGTREVRKLKRATRPVLNEIFQGSEWRLSRWEQTAEAPGPYQFGLVLSAGVERRPGNGSSITGEEKGSEGRSPRALGIEKYPQGSDGLIRREGQETLVRYLPKPGQTLRYATPKGEAEKRANRAGNAEGPKSLSEVQS
jgi:hypothetical protein